MSVERSRIEWKESEGPLHKMATIVIPKQTVDGPAQDAFYETSPDLPPENWST